jgi:hypothetical protein
MHYTVSRRERFARWVDDGCPGITLIEVNQEALQVSADLMLLQMRHCRDELPSALGETIRDRFGLKSSLRGRSYGEAARRLLAARATATPTATP